MSPFLHSLIAATPYSEIYTLSLHDALPIYQSRDFNVTFQHDTIVSDKTFNQFRNQIARRDRKSTRLNSSHITISYAVFCLKKKTSTYLKKGSFSSEIVDCRRVHLPTQFQSH